MERFDWLKQKNKYLLDLNWNSYMTYLLLKLGMNKQFLIYIKFVWSPGQIKVISKQKVSPCQFNWFSLV